MLTPVEIENKMFKKVKFGGYSIDEVEDFLETIITDYEILYKENIALKDRCDTMQESISYYKSIEAGIDQTLNNVEQEAEKIRNEVAEELEYIRANQEKLIQEKLANINSALIEKEVEFESLKKQMELYRIKIASMVEAQMKILKQSEENEQDI